MKNSLKSLIEGCRHSDPKAQRELYAMLAPRMFAVCRRYVKDKEQAEDILQEGFVTLFVKISTFKGEGSFEGWARKIFVNTALIQFRRNDALKFSDSIEDSQAVQMMPSEALEQKGAEEITDLIRLMPDGFRTVFNLYVIEGYTHEEIAEMLSITEGGSRSQLSRAKAWLRNKITQHRQV